MNRITKAFRILLVDDDYINNIITQEIIKNTKLADEIHIAMHGLEAVEFLEKSCVDNTAEGCPDLVLLDLNMPVMDGFEFLEKMKDSPIHKQLKIVVLSSSTDSRDVDRINKYNIGGFLSKPLTLDKFRNLYAKLFAD